MDYRLFRFVNRFAANTAWLHGVGRFTASTGIVAFALFLLGAWWTARRSERAVHGVAAAAWAGAAAPIALLVNVPISGSINRPRPFVAHPGVLTLVKHAADGGFPSDHATAVGAVAAGLIITNRRIGLVAAATALLIAASRVYIGVHYPGDVLAGLALGTGVALVGAPLVRPLLKRIAEHLAGTSLAPLISSKPTSRPSKEFQHV